jgi:hypothetical protein
MAPVRIGRVAHAAGVMALVAVAGAGLMLAQQRESRPDVDPASGKPLGSLVNDKYKPEGEAEVTKRLGFDPATHSAMANPYKMVPNWPHLDKPGGAIGIVPDEAGGVWLQHRGNPAIVHINAAGNVVASFPVSSGSGGASGSATYSYAHGMCRDRDGNFWSLDSGTFGDGPDTGIKGSTVFKYDKDGKLLFMLGKPGVGKADGVNTFIAPAACTSTPEGDLLIADGHWSRPNPSQQDGDRIVWVTRDGKFIKQFGRLGTGPGEFLGPHGLAFDSQGRLFVADRANNRIQIYDKNMNFVDDWKQFGRPSGIAILENDTLLVSDSESSYYGFRPANLELGPTRPASRNAGWKAGIWVGSAKDGSIKYFIPNTKPEGFAADEAGNIYAGLTGNCDKAPNGQCLQKYVLK